MPTPTLIGSQTEDDLVPFHQTSSRMRRDASFPSSLILSPLFFHLTLSNQPRNCPACLGFPLLTYNKLKKCARTHTHTHTVWAGSIISVIPLLLRIKHIFPIMEMTCSSSPCSDLGRRGGEKMKADRLAGFIWLLIQGSVIFEDAEYKEIRVCVALRQGEEKRSLKREGRKALNQIKFLLSGIIWRRYQTA